MFAENNDVGKKHTYTLFWQEELDFRETGHRYWVVTRAISEHHFFLTFLRFFCILITRLSKRSFWQKIDNFFFPLTLLAICRKQIIFCEFIRLGFTSTKKCNTAYAVLRFFIKIQDLNLRRSER